MRVGDSDRSASGLDYTESLDTAELEEPVDRTCLPNLILGMEKHRNRLRIPTLQDLISQILIVIVGSGRGYHHVNVGSFVEDCLMIKRSRVGKGRFVEVELELLWVAEGARNM